MVNSLWFKWKSFRLPWRKTFLVGQSEIVCAPLRRNANPRVIIPGQDLAGNTFWEFKDVLNAGRFRRIVKFDPKTHYGDVKVTPQWHQWLRYVRENPPSIQEQQQDLIRQAQIKELARLADERWASKPSFLDKPQAQQPEPGTQIGDATLNPTTAEAASPAQAQASSASSSGTSSQADSTSASKQTKKEENPWAKASNPGDGWQPESWTPTSHR
ncbi:hypothetical protein NUU61_008097 [Penicillium alfredii]|uniref:NADH dehydrogenase [ubiquinone] 1 alpha subcomplex subunit n=1 Tax=Penicillium alfredii TaxID=1506179 RepID=A0A9W9JZ30_9EURO|nr:uncharacterized protein NUU61_008097 [Penicillium alfredii]KAJ5086790.1 hypothetical protein NUU61_008097 [Penicillium alfredii]